MGTVAWVALWVAGGAKAILQRRTTTSTSLRPATEPSPERAVLFYATDYPEAGKGVAKLITASGFAPVSVGGIDQSMRIEVGRDLHEFGKLGELVSACEAQALV